jgi:hypothetical protein
VPSRGREIVDQDHRAARISDALKRRQLNELFWVTDPGAGAIREYLKERQTEAVGYDLGNLLPKAIRPARVTARDAGDRAGGALAMKLADKGRDQLGRLFYQSRVERALPLLQRGNVVGFGASPPCACADPSDIVAPENRRPVHE